MPPWWHVGGEVHDTGVPPHLPAVQRSASVHRSVSVHTVPSGEGGFEHDPRVGSQTPASKQVPSEVQVTLLAGVHLPCWQVSLRVQALLSLQGVLAGDSGLVHVPLPVSHLPAMWHWSSATHVTGFPPLHAPFWHESVCVHALPSLHLVPFGAAGDEHRPVPASHAPAR